MNSPKKKVNGIFAIIILIVAVALILIATPLIKKYTPSNEKADFEEIYELGAKEDMIVVVNDSGEIGRGFYIDGQPYIDYETVHDQINSRFFWDEKEQILRYTLPQELITVTPETETYMVNKTKQTESYTICTIKNDTMYLAMDFVENLTDLRYKFYESPNRLTVSTKWGDIEYTTVKKNTEVRVRGGIKSPILTEVSKGDLVTVLEEGDNWDKICTEDGFIGYMKSKAVGKNQVVVCENTNEQPTYNHIQKDFPINMAWHQVTTQAANNQLASVLEGTRGINVISPTWFYLNDNEGGIMSLASHDYVENCHQQGMEVWALVSNLENPDVDCAEVLNTTSSRDHLVNELIAKAIQYRLDGINVDFEALESEAGEGFIQFIRELSLKCENNDIVLSVDNYVPSAYTALYQRQEQALFADYVILMAYDEHFNGSEEEGSVASLGFVKQGVSDTLKEVPAQQLILGIPFYTRIWELAPSETAEKGYEVSSQAVGMSEVDTRLAANGVKPVWLEDCGQYYAEYEKDGNTYKIWMEEQNSIEEKLKVYQENNLAGVSFWKLGFEKSNIWDTVADYITKE